MREQKIEEYKDKFANPYVAAGYSWVDAVIHCDDNANRHRVLRKTATGYAEISHREIC